MLPEGWTINRLEDLAILERGKFSVRPRNDPRYFGGQTPFIQTGDITHSSGIINTHTQTLNQLGLSVSKVFPPDTILMTIAANIGDTAITTFPVACPDSVVGILAKEGEVEIKWLHFYLRSLKNTLEDYAPQNAQKNINLQTLRPLLIKTPPLPEQKKIAAILSTWDQAIEATEKLLTNSQQQKKALMQQLLTGKKRLPGFTGEWEIKKIQNLADRITHSGADSNLRILMISSTLGFVEQNKKYSRYMAGESLKNYILIKNGDFAYNKGNSKSYQFGCVFELSEFDEGLVPNIYVCFKFKSGHDRAFYKNLFLFDFLKPQLRAVVNSGVRNNGLLNIRSSQFMEMLVPVPPLPEQKAIAAILTKADEEITLLKADLTRLRQEKKALMQQLLTGKRRVIPDPEAG